MEKFIALCICLPLLVVFIPQYGLQTKNNEMISRAEVIVDAAKEEAKQEGYFTTDIINQMESSFEDMGVESGELVINVTTTPKYRVNSFDDREMIEYEIGIPIEKKIAANDFFGITDADNKTVYYFEGSFASERIN